MVSVPQRSRGIKAKNNFEVRVTLGLLGSVYSQTSPWSIGDNEVLFPILIQWRWYH